MLSANWHAIPSAILLASAACAQAPAPVKDPFPKPIEGKAGVILVRFTEFAALPDLPGQSARPMTLVNEPGTKRLFVNDMRGPLYSVSYDAKTVTKYLDINTAGWNAPVQAQGAERGFQSFAFHPQFNQRGTPGYGKIYAYTDTSNMTPPADFKPEGNGHTHDAVLLEWTAKNPAAATYDGDAPRELMRWAHPFSNHNGGHMAFNPAATPRDADFGLLYFGVADGGSGGDPYKHAQNLGSSFGKILRIDPMGRNSANKKYGIPPSNPFVKQAGALGEIYAYGIRNAQRLFWDSKTKLMYMSDIGQNTVEEISPVPAGGNLGWNVWEASFQFARGGVLTGEPRGDSKMVYPIVEFDHTDELLQSGVATVGGMVYRDKLIPQLTGKLLFADNPSGEIFYVDADNLPKGGQDAIRRVLFDDNGTTKTLLQLIKEKNTAQGKPPASRADLRFGEGPGGQIFILNKRDGVVRLLVPNGK